MRKTHQKYAMFDFAIISLVFYRKYVNINDFLCFVLKTALKLCLYLTHELFSLDQTSPDPSISMIFEISALLRGLENLCLCSQITLKLVISRTTDVMMDLNRRRNLIKQLFMLDQTTTDPFQ